jgi:hypothetical protein
MRKQLRAMMLVAAITLLASSADAQQILDVHGASSVETRTQSTSWGGGIAAGSQWMPASAAFVGLFLGADYLREQHLGRARTSISAELTVAPPWSSEYIVPYVGGGVSGVWSGGQYSEYSGPRLGLVSLAGVRFLFSGTGRIGAKLEGRFSYLTGIEHALGTRVGLLIGL